MSKKALVVEDDNNIAELLRMYLEKDGFTVETADNGELGVQLAADFDPDVILLDVMLPIKDGFTVCTEVREFSTTPILMLTAKGETEDKILGLQIGADDYITKPFDVKELLARVNAVLRRADAPRTMGTHRLEFDKLKIDLDNHALLINDVKIDTPPKELELLYQLASTPDRVYTRNQLLDKVWGFDYFGDSRTVDVHIKRLRTKLENVSDEWRLKTVWGVGYKFEVGPEK